MFKTEDRDTLIQNLLDREEIRNLALKYAHYVWQGKADEWVDLYAEDAMISSEHPDRPTSRGHDSLRALFNEVASTSKPRPFVHNHVVNLLGPSEATGTCYSEVRISIDGKNGLVVGVYDDRYRKVDGVWKFAERKSTIEYFGPANEYRVPE